MPNPGPSFQTPRFAFEHAGQTSTLYFFRSGQFLKIGIAADMEKRLTGLRCGNPHGIEVAGSLPVPKSLAYQVERMVHVALREQRRAGEWFEVEVAEAVRIAQTIIPAAFLQDGQWATQAAVVPAGMTAGEKARWALDQHARSLMGSGAV